MYGAVLGNVVQGVGRVGERMGKDEEPQEPPRPRYDFARAQQSLYDPYEATARVYESAPGTGYGETEARVYEGRLAPGTEDDFDTQGTAREAPPLPRSANSYEPPPPPQSRHYDAWIQPEDRRRPEPLRLRHEDDAGVASWQDRIRRLYG